MTAPGMARSWRRYQVFTGLCCTGDVVAAVAGLLLGWGLWTLAAAANAVVMAQLFALAHRRVRELNDVPGPAAAFREFGERVRRLGAGS